MNAIPALKERLTQIENKLNGHQENIIAQQKKMLEEKSKKIQSVTNYEESELLLQELTSLNVDSSLVDQQDLMISSIITKQSYLTTDSQPLVIPSINNNTPWVAWLEHFATRLKSKNLTTIKKLEDLGTANDFIQAAREVNIPDLNEKLTNIENIAKQLYIVYWQEHADQVMADTSPSLNEISNLLTEGNSFTTQEQQINKERIIKLNRYVIKATLDEFSTSLGNIKKLEYSVSNDTYIQLLSALQSQYLQVLLRLQNMDEQYPNSFKEDIEITQRNIGALGQLITAYRQKLTIAEINKSESQRNRFVAWAKKQIDLAKEYDNEGEKIANQWSTTRSNEAAVEKYIRAWQTLMAVHPGDLSSADPALYQSYTELKSLIENHWTPDDSQRSRINYKRITNF